MQWHTKDEKCMKNIGTIQLNDNKKLLTNHQYFIHVFNIIHKLLDALVASRLTLTWKVELLGILIWFFWLYFSKQKRKKELLKGWTIVLDLLNYSSICHSSNLHPNVVHPNLNLSSLEPSTRPSPFWKIHFVHPSQHHIVFFRSTQEQGEDHGASPKQNPHCWDL